MKIFSSLEIRNFKLYWIGTVLSSIGTWIQMVAQSWLIFQLTNSEFLLGFIGFLSSIPILVFSLPSGVIADKKDKRYILIFTQSALMILSFILGFLTSSGSIKVWHIMIIVLFTGSIMALDGPARQSFVLELVGSEKLTNAIGLNSAAFNAARVIGPAIAGVIIGSMGAAVCFYINGISFIAVIAALLAMKKTKIFQNYKSQNQNIWDNLKQGFNYLFSNKKVLLLIVLVGIQSLIVMPYATFMPVFAESVFHKGAKGLGILMSSAGFGALLGALYVATFSSKSARNEKIIIQSYGILSVSLILFAISKIYYLSIVFLVFIGWATITSIGNINSLLQINVPDELRGRIMSMFMLAFAGIIPFGSLLAGSISSILNVQFTFAFFGLLCLLVTVWLHFKGREFL